MIEGQFNLGGHLGRGRAGRDRGRPHKEAVIGQQRDPGRAVQLRVRGAELPQSVVEGGQRGMSGAVAVTLIGLSGAALPGACHVPKRCSICGIRSLRGRSLTTKIESFSGRSQAP
mgnify:CR=1 FL=1